MNEPRKKTGLSWLAAGVISTLMVLMFLVVIFIPHFIGHDHDPHIPCVAALRMIEGAKNTWALENNESTDAVPTDEDLFGEACYIREKPKCSLGGIYILGSVGEKPRCSIPGHTF